jgi:hypothetical protein
MYGCVRTIEVFKHGDVLLETVRVAGMTAIGFCEEVRAG